jgi:hypothetical protein
MIKKIKIEEIRTGCTDPYEHGIIRMPEGGLLSIAEKINEIVDLVNDIYENIEIIRNKVDIIYQDSK